MPTTVDYCSKAFCAEHTFGGPQLATSFRKIRMGVELMGKHWKKERRTMGGYNSGRSGGRPTVEGSLTLDLSKLMRDRALRPGHSDAGTLSWHNVATGERTSSIRYAAALGSQSGALRLVYTSTSNWSRESRNLDYSVELVTTPQPFGGVRWWFLCPRTGAHVTKLHLPPGAWTFASRSAYRLGYRSQRETPRDRALSRAFKLRRRLGATGAIGDYVPKPKWMRWRTYDREMLRIAEAEFVVDGHMVLTVEKLMARRPQRP